MISYVIPACNDERRLGRTLIALREAARLAVEPFEMLVVDAGSTDRTPTIAAGHGARVIALRRATLSAARNAGAQEARGAMLAFIDPGTWVNAALLRATVAAMRKGAVGGGCAVRHDDRRGVARALDHTVGAILPMARLAADGYLFCTRDALTACGGFEERLDGAGITALRRALARHGRFVMLRERAGGGSRRAA